MTEVQRPGLAPPSAPPGADGARTWRCFVATWPPPEICDALARAPRPPLARARWSEPEQWHVTLRFLGDVPVGDVAALAARLAARPWPGGVVARGGPATRFLGEGLLIWPVEGLAELAAAVAEATRGTGEPPTRPFLGHITLARARRGYDLRRQHHLLSPLAATWAVTSIALVRSRLAPAGATYTTLVQVGLAP